ncbi:MAG: MFS transporter [Bacteroidota bacterium]|nr:MFS transporter [Bacteroidota bacterium]
MVISENKTTQVKPLSSFLVTLMAVSAGVAVANIYYNQPILKNIAAEFKATETQAGIISMLSQIGYGLGLFFITPLGDKLKKKNLIIGLQVMLFIALLLVTFTSSIVQVWILSVFISLFSVSVQVIIPMAAGMDSRNRGKTVGTIFTGVLIGILAARVFSGTIAEWFGWRNVYLFSAIAVAGVTVLLKIYLPPAESAFDGSYFQLLNSALKQFGRFPQLRRLSVIGMLQFGLFCSFWTTLTFHLSGSPFHFKSDIIGLFGLVAIAGALLAPLIGKKADKGESNRVRFMAIGLIIISVLMMLIFQSSVIALATAVLLLDIGAQALQVTNVALIYTLDESSHSRINTVYMTSFFIGGALGTFIGVLCWEFGGWTWVTGQMLISALLIVVLLIKEKRQTQS